MSSHPKKDDFGTSTSLFDVVRHRDYDAMSTMTSTSCDNSVISDDEMLRSSFTSKIRCAVLGCGMMGQEHCSYIMGYSSKLQIDYLCDPHQPSIDKCCQVLRDFNINSTTNGSSSSDSSVSSSSSSMSNVTPTLLHHEDELIQHVQDIDLLVICTPNYLHTDTIIRWGQYDHLTILVEKPVAVSRQQHTLLLQQSMNNKIHANIWVAMEYRFIPAIAQLITCIRNGMIGDIKMVTIRENRFPFLHKVGRWNRDRNKTGDSLVEKCCHFFDLMRLISGMEVNLSKVRTMAQRGLNYHDEPLIDIDEEYVPIIDAAYVTLPFISNEKVKAMACLELCMYADGSRHQEEVIVTGTKGRLEAYLPENKVYSFIRPSNDQWINKSEPPPKESIISHVYDCSDVCQVHGIGKDNNSNETSPIPTHGGYHYSSTAIEWYRLLECIQDYHQTGLWKPLVSLNDGLRAVEIGLQATESIVNIDE